MAIPVVYNLRSVKERWTSSGLAVLRISRTEAVFVAILGLGWLYAYREGVLEWK